MLKKLNTGRIRPVLEYEASPWAITAKGKFIQLSKIQNLSLQIITGAMRPKPILEMENITCLWSL